MGGERCIEDLVWQSDRGEQPSRLMLMAPDGRVRVLSQVAEGGATYVEIMPLASLDEIVRTADTVLSGRTHRLPTTLTHTRLAAGVMRLFAQMRRLETELADMRRGQRSNEDLIAQAELAVAAE